MNSDEYNLRELRRGNYSDRQLGLLLSRGTRALQTAWSIYPADSKCGPETRAEIDARLDRITGPEPPASGPVVECFPLLVPANFAGPTDIDEDGADLRWDGRECPGQDPRDGYRPKIGAGFDVPRGDYLHSALDLMAAEGVVVRCIGGPAEVVEWTYRGAIRPGASHSLKGGNYVRTRDERGWEFYYAHLRDLPLVETGDILSGGQTLGFVGRSGNAARDYGEGLRGCPHLHLSLTDPQGKKQDPWPYLRELYDAGGWRQELG
jgi:murein DD-endopeptidase MepM/ murein hydrolase activator NlpD